MKLAVPLLVVSSVLAMPASAQQDGRALLHPIMAPVRFAGVYHIGTGTWTRGAPSSSAISGAAIVYDNTCPSGYYFGNVPGLVITDEGRLPSPTSPVSANLWGLGHDSEVGTQASYTIDGFQIGYCTLESSARSYTIDFHQAYVPCAPLPATPTASFVLTGLPASPTAGVQACWTVDIDLCAGSQSFTLQADADGVFNGNDNFGWSERLNSPAPSGGDGMLIAGGLLVGGSFQGCSGSDGTLFDSGSVSAVFPANQEAFNLGCGGLAPGTAPEPGSGMGSLDKLRFDGGISYSGCFWFGGNPQAGQHLQLYATSVNYPSTGPGVAFCDPGVGGVLACPCSNPPSGAGRGCDNSSSTGGATIASSGQALLPQDTLALTTAQQRPSGTSILLQGTSSIPAGSVFGQGVRCVGGFLKRLYIGSASAGSFSAPPPAGQAISSRSATLGDLIFSGTHRFYSVYYRDPIVLGGCPGSATWNTTPALDVLWN